MPILYGFTMLDGHNLKLYNIINFYYKIFGVKKWNYGN